MSDSAKRASSHHPSVLAYAASEDAARAYDASHGLDERFLIDGAWTLRHLPPHARVLDLGCGTGRHLVLLQDAGHAAVGVDLSRHMLLRARRKLTRLHLPARLYHGDVCRLRGLPGGEFDAVLMMGSLLGLLLGRDLRLRALAQARRLLRPGGRLLVHVYSRAQHWRDGWPGRRRYLASNLLFWLRGLEPGDRVMKDYGAFGDLYLHGFLRSEILELLGRAGFRVMTVDGISTEASPQLLTGRFSQRDAQAFLIGAERLPVR